jgi:hypothetical protein
MMILQPLMEAFTVCKRIVINPFLASQPTSKDESNAAGKRLVRHEVKVYICRAHPTSLAGVQINTKKRFDELNIMRVTYIREGLSLFLISRIERCPRSNYYSVAFIE